ncbi:MAG: hypothetical protein V4663_13475 [Bacteroidota bacterium]
MFKGEIKNEPVHIIFSMVFNLLELKISIIDIIMKAKAVAPLNSAISGLRADICKNLKIKPTNERAMIEQKNNKGKLNLDMVEGLKKSNLLIFC